MALLFFFMFPIAKIGLTYKTNRPIYNKIILSYIMSIFAMANFSTVHFYFFSIMVGVVYYLVSIVNVNVRSNFENEMLDPTFRT